MALFGILGVFLSWQYSTIKEFHTLELKNFFTQTNKIVNVLLEKEKSEIREIVFSNINQYSQEKKHKVINIDNIDFIFSTQNDKVVHLDGYTLFVDANLLANTLVNKFKNKNFVNNILQVEVDNKMIFVMVHKEKIIDNKFGKVIGSLWGVTVLNENVSILKEFKKDTGVEELALVDLDNQIVASTLVQKKIKQFLSENINDDIFISSDTEFLINRQSLYNYDKLKVVFIVNNKQYEDVLSEYKNKAVFAVSILFVLGILLYFLIKLKFINKLLDLRFFIQNTLQKKDTVYQTSSIMELDIIALEFGELFLEFQRYQENLEKTVKDKTNENIKQLELLQQQSKMAQMGEMIGAIAHQWRQPLNVVSTGIQNLKYDYKDGNLNDEEFINNFIDENKKTIKFMSKTIDDFRSFFRTDKEQVDFKILETIQSVLDMQSSQLKSHEVTVNIIGDEYNYYGLQSEFQQVIFNIVNNAKDAFVEKKTSNPKLTISLINNIITIEDNAGGIPKEIIKRIFDPYFTTKEQGKGTGIGLYISKLIIENNMESILKVENTGNGVKFIIVLKDVST